MGEYEWSRYGRFQNLVSNASSLKLDELYKPALDHVSTWDKEEKEILRSIFSHILFAKRPLYDEEINGILDVEMDVTPNLLSYFRSLVRYEKGQPIRIHHASFYDYLTSCKDEIWYIDVEKQKVYIASKCLERMGDLLRYDICDIQSNYVLNTDVPDIDNRVTQYVPSFLKYIRCNWARRLQDVSYSEELCSQPRFFVYNQLLSWFEVLSFTNTFNDHVEPALLFVIKWVGVSILHLFTRLLTKHSSRTMTQNYLLFSEMFIGSQVYIRSQSLLAHPVNNSINRRVISQ